MDKTDRGIFVDRILNGYVIDHIRAGWGITVYQLLGLDQLDCSIALMQNVKSSKFGRKDMIKIEGLIDIDMDALGYIDQNITLITVENERIYHKQALTLPQILRGVIECKNPRCITSIESSLTHEFRLVDSKQKVYRCVYCEQEGK